MKKLLLAACFVAGGVSLAAYDAGASKVEPVTYPFASPIISTNEGGCWDKCKTCEQKCGDNNSCKDGCWTTNDNCCKGVGGKGVYKMCGCTDQ